MCIYACMCICISVYIHISVHGGDYAGVIMGVHGGSKLNPSTPKPFRYFAGFGRCSAPLKAYSSLIVSDFNWESRGPKVFRVQGLGYIGNAMLKQC